MSVPPLPLNRMERTSPSRIVPITEQTPNLAATINVAKYDMNKTMSYLSRISQLQNPNTSSKYRHLFEKIDMIQTLNRNVMEAKGFLKKESSWKAQLSN